MKKLKVGSKKQMSLLNRKYQILELFWVYHILI